jgi:hypothetical protein
MGFSCQPEFGKEGGRGKISRFSSLPGTSDRDLGELLLYEFLPFSAGFCQFLGSHLQATE